MKWHQNLLGRFKLWQLNFYHFIKLNYDENDKKTISLRFSSLSINKLEQSQGYIPVFLFKH